MSSWLGNNRNAIAILRVSSNGQEENGSHDLQEKEVRIYCENYSLDIDKIFRIVESAKDSKARKQYHEALLYAKKRSIRHILFYMSDREARNLTDNEVNEKRVMRDEIVIHYVRDRKILHKGSSDSDFLSRDMNAIVNKQFIRTLTTKVEDGMLHKAEQGWFPSNGVPYGYITSRPKDENGREIKRSQSIIVPASENIQKWIRREFELRSQNVSFEGIQRQVLDEGLVPLKYQKTYRASSIEKRIKNQFYAGYFSWKGKTYKGNHELFISPELFSAAQNPSGMRIPYSKKTDGIFAGGWMTCSFCGCYVVYDPKERYRKTLGVTRLYKYYRCSNSKKLHKEGLKNISEDTIFEQLSLALDQITISESLAQELSKSIDKLQSRTNVDVKKQIASCQQALSDLDIEEDALYSDYKKDLLNESSYKRQLSRIQNSRSQNLKLIEDAQMKNSDENLLLAKSIIELSINAKSLWLRRSPVEKKEFLDLILSNVELDGVNVRFKTKKPFDFLRQTAFYKLGTPTGIRTPVTAVKRRCPRPG